MEYNHEVEIANQRSYRDALTGVKNKMAYLETLKQIEKRVESGALKEYGIVVFDVNNLKHINDTMGHDAGDEYIKSACSLICVQFKHSPVFRVGGDEFVAILENDDYAQREELIRSFEHDIEENHKNKQVVVASGCDIYDAGRDNNYNDVFRRADKKMYERKQQLKAM